MDALPIAESWDPTLSRFIIRENTFECLFYVEPSPRRTWKGNFKQLLFHITCHNVCPIYTVLCRIIGWLVTQTGLGKSSPMMWEWNNQTNSRLHLPRKHAETRQLWVLQRYLYATGQEDHDPLPHVARSFLVYAVVHLDSPSLETTLYALHHLTSP